MNAVLTPKDRMFWNVALALQDLPHLSFGVQDKVRPLAHQGLLKDAVVTLLREAGLAKDQPRGQCGCLNCLWTKQQEAASVATSEDETSTLE